METRGQATTAQTLDKLTALIEAQQEQVSEGRRLLREQNATIQQLMSQVLVPRSNDATDGDATAPQPAPRRHVSRPHAQPPHKLSPDSSLREFKDILIKCVPGGAQATARVSPLMLRAEKPPAVYVFETCISQHRNVKLRRCSSESPAQRFQLLPTASFRLHLTPELSEGNLSRCQEKVTTAGKKRLNNAGKFRATLTLSTAVVDTNINVFRDFDDALLSCVAAHDHAGARIVLSRNKPGEGDVRTDAPKYVYVELQGVMLRTSRRSALRFVTVNFEPVKADVGTSANTLGQTHASSSTQLHLQSPAAVSYNPVLRSCSKFHIADVYYYSTQW
ncbi:hypothetical protein E2C01_039168 [Portunus trituberculatus]|uniref:Uncharacterized protein n=1 Tax=Portunus trituberculatus TaxID=210409 RepID=A0A5B7FJX6_PORTR|nr:hypothetical protein [Portunus trituberculatus]